MSKVNQFELIEDWGCEKKWWIVKDGAACKI
jgi:hypothetical protein